MTNSSPAPNSFDHNDYRTIFFRCVVYLVIGFMTGQLASSLVYMYYFGDDLNVMLQAVENPEANLSLGMPFLLIQGVNSLVCFLVFPLLFISKTQFPIHYDFWGKNMPVVVSSFSNLFMIMLFVLPLSSVMVEWNHLVEFPDFMSGFENWAQASEKRIAALTKVITHFNSLPEFLVGLLIIGVLAAVGEELVFRGLFQPLFIQLFRNKHLGILVTAFVFGAIHLQFFSFLPRFALGILFGYMYFYSKNLWVPIFGHFVNNSLSLFFVYRYGMDETTVPVEALDSYPILLFLFSGSLVLGVFFYLKRLWAKNMTT